MVTTQSHLHLAPSTRAISAEGCACQIQNAISPAFRALDAHDLCRGLRRINLKRNLTCISGPRHARLRRGLRASNLTCVSRPRRARCAGPIQNAISPAFRALGTISAEGCVSWGSGGTAPTSRELEKKSERIRRCEMCSCEDVDVQM